jgi:hypothetical protein
MAPLKVLFSSGAPLNSAAESRAQPVHFDERLLCVADRVEVERDVDQVDLRAVERPAARPKAGMTSDRHSSARVANFILRILSTFSVDCSMAAAGE